MLQRRRRTGQDQSKWPQPTSSDSLGNKLVQAECLKSTRRRWDKENRREALRSEQVGCWTYQGEGEARDAARTQTPACREGLPHPQRQPMNGKKPACGTRTPYASKAKEGRKQAHQRLRGSCCSPTPVATLKRWGTVAAPRN